jgi:predicted acyl esterase
VTLNLASEAASLDVSAVLSLSEPQGPVRPLTQGFRRLWRGGRSSALIDLRATCATLPAGARLRLSLAGAAHPAFAVNPGTGQRPETERAIDREPVAIAVLTGGAAPSHLTLTLA